MSIIFKPTGSLDVSTDPSVLAQEGDGRTIISGEMQRCKNLRLNENGVAKTRRGTYRYPTQMDPVPNTLIELSGYRFSLGKTIFEDETALETGLSSAEWSAAKYNSYNSTTENIFALNGTDSKRIEHNNVHAWGIEAPSEAPTIVAGASSGLTGDYNAKYTYCRKEGSTVICESDPSPAASAAVTLADESLSVTWDASADAQVTHVRVYRTLTSGSLYYHDQDIAIGTVTVDTDTADASLGDEVETDHDQPPAGTFLIGPNYNGTLFILKDNLVYFSSPKQPEYWPTTYYIEVSTPNRPLQSACFWNSQLYVADKHEIYLITGTGALTFFPVSQSAITGAPSRQGMYPVAGRGIFHVGSDGVYLFNSAKDMKLTAGRYDAIFNGQSVGSMPAVDTVEGSWIIERRDHIFFGYRAAGNVYPRHVIVMDLETSKTSYYDWGIEIPYIAFDEENSRLIALDSNGYVWQLESNTHKTDNGEDISWDIMSKDFTLSTRAHFPRWNKYDVDASNAVGVTGELYLDGVSHQSHTITGDRITKRRLVETGNGERCALRVSGSGTVSIYQVESE